ncbi:MAG TPA: hypothetical protein VGI79_04450 [Caulobacteraceae bacterium]|jgi:hypothetical protein
MKRTVLSALRTSLAVVALLAAGAPVSAMASGLGGSMQGRVTQNDTSETYAMNMTLDGAGGRISYPSAPCDGDLQFMNSDGTTYRYKEHITRGDCIDGGIIQLHRRTPGDDTAWVFRWDAEDVSVKGVVQGSGVADVK